MSLLHTDFLSQFQTAVQADDWAPDACCDALFAVVYCLPPAMQRALALHTLLQYLPIFEARQPSVLWPRTMLADVPAFSATYEDSIPESPDDMGDSENTYDAALMGLQFAEWHKAQRPLLAANHSVAIRSSRSALAFHAIRLEREARTQEPRAGESSSDGASFLDNPTFKATLVQGWRDVLQWLLAHDAEAALLPTPAEEIGLFLGVWQDTHGSVLGPRHIAGMRWTPYPSETP